MTTNTTKYDQEIESLKKYQSELDDLFIDEKKDLVEKREALKRSQGRTSGLTYVSTQVSNLVSIKTAAINVSKIIADLKSKDHNENFKTDSGADDGSVSTAARRILDSIASRMKVTNTDEIKEEITSDNEVVLIINSDNEPQYFGEIDKDENIIGKVGKDIANIKLMNHAENYCIDENDECFRCFIDVNEINW